jgi:hypothetical protein
MSNFSPAHTVTKFDAKKSQALSGQRLAKVRYKTTAKQDAKFPSVCVSVPFIGTDSLNSETVSRLVPHIRAMLENAQDGVIRSLYESSEGNLSLVTDSDISIDACIKYLETESEGGRLTKEFIEAWFDSSVAEYLTALMVDKLGYTQDVLSESQEDTVKKHLAGYRGLYSSLAGGKTMLQDTQIKSLSKVLDIVDTDDTCEKLKARLNAMLNKPKIEDLLEL